MDIVRLLLLTVLPVVALACVVGVVVGRHQVKKAAGQLNPILSSRERIVYATSILLGVVFLLVGIFYQPVAEMHHPDQDFFWEEGRDFEHMNGMMEMPMDMDDSFFDDSAYGMEEGEYPEYELPYHSDDYESTPSEETVPAPSPSGGASAPTIPARPAPSPAPPRPAPRSGTVIIR